MTDQLAQIEDRAKSFHATVWLGDGGEPAGILYEVADEMADDVLALVEIAKAARVRLEYGHNDTCDLMLGDSTHPYPCTCGHHELRAALSVLDDREET